ncbi:cellulase family glycosylhydrolase [Streptomyces sp. DSM 44915]|uniref:Cellulase family glycosylhydrolase n=1 Tax=Streptomyces chisholmiae TaxID=3075540 RepID=A0ABU2JZP0_9ACTN|nr:cellulase family glycosylhydrolase [Streptomyces sp. DSM 44915]MDT0270468.1 cellulase family glycosylhydrolase [Streptomyces sp. DSM 44915]
MRRNAAKLRTTPGTSSLPTAGADDATVWIGVNYWSRTGGPLMWRDYRPEVVDEELRVMREHGITLTRSFFFWPDFMPAENTLDPAMLAHYDDFLDRHQAQGMHTIPTFIVGHMSGQNWDPVWRGGRDIFGDPSFVAQQEWYVRELTDRWKDHPAVAGWLLTNEIPIYGDWRSRGIGTLDATTVTAWAKTLVNAVRSTGARQPVSVGDGAWGVEMTGADNGFRVRDLEPLIDFHGPHVYRMETDPVRQHLGAAFVCELLDLGGKPVIMEEFGVTSDYVSEENAAHYYRQLLHNTLLAGATGWMPWNNTDYDALWDQEPYSHHPFEMHFGITDDAGRPKEQLREVKRFTELLARVDFARLSRPDTGIALVVSSFLEKMYPFTQPEDASSVLAHTRQAYVAAREADLPVGVAREVDGLPDDCALYLLPSAKQLTAGGWRHLVARAEAGATVYASFFMGEHIVQRGPWWPKLDETFGVVKRLRYGLTEPIEDDRLELTFQRDFGTIKAGERLVFAVAGTENSRSYLPVEPAGAEVLAVDAHGRPALLTRRVGAGQLVLSTYPLEHMAAITPRVNPEPTWRLYAALAAEAGVTPEVTVDDPRVLVGRMTHEDERSFVWLVSQHEETRAVTPVLTAGGALRDLDGQPLGTVELPPFGVLVAELVGDTAATSTADGHPADA